MIEGHAEESRARRRGRAALEAIALEDADLGDRRFDKVFAFNVAPFWQQPAAALGTVREHLARMAPSAFLGRAPLRAGASRGPGERAGDRLREADFPSTVCWLRTCAGPRGWRNGAASGRMNTDPNTVSRSLASSSQPVANFVADWDEQEASRVERIALLQSQGAGHHPDRRPRHHPPTDHEKTRLGGPYDFMRRVLASERGGALYSKRMPMVEPVFAQIKANRRIDRLKRKGRGVVTARNGA